MNDQKYAYQKKKEISALCASPTFTCNWRNFT